MLLTATFVKLGSLLLGLIGIGFLITIHEIGHFIFCKLFGVLVPSFSIGFGPALWKKTIGETTFQLSAVPLGGYVEMAGSAEIGQGEQKEAHRTDDRSLLQKPYWQKMLIMFGGILFNLMFAYLITIFVFLIGAPGSPLIAETITTRVEHVQENSLAAQAGVQSGDLLMLINNETIVLTQVSQSLEKIKQSDDKTLVLTVNRAGSTQQKTVTLQESSPALLGVQFTTQPLAPVDFITACKKGIALTNQYIINTVGFIKQLFVRRSLEGAGGPVGIIAAMGKSAEKGFSLYLLLLAVISINLAILNLLPLPILDGGQALLYTIEAIIRRQLPESIKLGIHMACWILFLLLTLYLTYCDLINLFVSWSCKA